MDPFPNYLIKSPTVLLTGPTGAGKSRMARELVKARGDHATPFILAHLASLSNELIESELFGHKRGAFTGASYDRDGYFDRAQGGTLFLDEIGELSLSGQKKLLYLLEERSYCAVGDNRVKIFRGKIIAATNRNLKKMVEDKLFREDLYYRIAPYTLELPAFKEYSSNQQLEILNQINIELGLKFEMKPLAITASTLQWLERYPFNGNVRELKHIVEFHYLDERTEIDLVNCPLLDRELEHQDALSFSGKPLSYQSVTEKVECHYFTHALNYYRGRVNETARKIGISKTTLIAKIRKYGINTFQIKAHLLETGLRPI